MSNPHAALELLRSEVEMLRRQNFEMDEDGQLFCDMVEGCTGFDDLVHHFLRNYFEQNAVASALRERADIFDRRRDLWKQMIKRARSIAHMTEKQVFPEGTIYEHKHADDLLYEEHAVPDQYWRVDTVRLRRAIKDGETNAGRLVPSNENPTLIIKVK